MYVIIIIQRKTKESVHMCNLNELLNRVPPCNFFADYKYYESKTKRYFDDNYGVDDSFFSDLLDSISNYKKSIEELNRYVKVLYTGCKDTKYVPHLIVYKNLSLVNKRFNNQLFSEEELRDIRNNNLEFTKPYAVPMYADYIGPDKFRLSDFSISAPSISYDNITNTTHEKPASHKTSFKPAPNDVIEVHLTPEGEAQVSAMNIEFAERMRERENHVPVPDPDKPKPLPADPVTDMKDIQRIRDQFYVGVKSQLIATRNDAIFTTGIGTGLRCNDLLNLRIRDILNDDDTFKREITVYESKTHKMNHPHIIPEVEAILSRYIYMRRKAGDELNRDDYLFTSQKGETIQSHTYYHILRKIQQKLKLNYQLGCHSMRKTFAYWTIRQHYNDQNILFSLQEMLNHDSPKITLHYSGHTKEHLSQMYDDMSGIISGKATPVAIEPATSQTDKNEKIDQILAMLSKLTAEE